MKKDNVILADFESVVDLDLAMFKFIKYRYNNADYVNQEIINENDERIIKYRLLSRLHINPLEILIPGYDTTDMYFDIMNNKYEDLLEYAMAYDTFALLVTLLKYASSLDVIIRCKNELEERFINNLNPLLKTKIIPTRMEINLSEYSVLWIKYFAYALELINVEGKHIYIAAAKYNMEENKNLVDASLSNLFGDLNIIHLMDMYTDVKYRYIKEDNDDNNEYSAGEESKRSSE